MADRVRDSIVARSQIWALESAWVQPLKTYFSHRKSPNATNIGHIIGRLEQVDQSQAFMMYAGQFKWAGESHKATPKDIFQVEASEGWLSELYDLNWLKYFATSQRNLHALYALQILQNWVVVKTSKSKWSDIVFNLAVDGAQLFKNSEGKMLAGFLKIVSTSVHRLSNVVCRTPAEAIAKSISLFYATVVFRGFETHRKTAIDLFNNNIAKLIHADGGPISRNPADAVDLLAKLLPLRDALKAQHQSLPHAAHDVIARMMPFLSMLQHGDGGLAGFRNADPRVELIKSIQLLDDTLAVSPSLAPHTGYARIAQGKSCLMMDVKSNFETEFSDGTQRLFRCASASAEVPTTVEHQDMPQGEILYIAKSEIHQRRIFLSKDGKDLRFEERSTTPIEISFEINTILKVTSMRDGAGIMFVTPAHAVWQLSLRGGEILLAKNGAVLKIISAEGKLNWALKKQEKAIKSSSRKNQEIPDLLS
jgi:hypothetical protein